MTVANSLRYPVKSTEQMQELIQVFIVLFPGGWVNAGRDLLQVDHFMEMPQLLHLGRKGRPDFADLILERWLSSSAINIIDIDGAVINIFMFMHMSSNGERGGDHLIIDMVPEVELFLERVFFVCCHHRGFGELFAQLDPLQNGRFQRLLVFCQEQWGVVYGFLSHTAYLQ